MNDKFIAKFNSFANFIEIVVAVGIAAACLISIYTSFVALLGMDWTNPNTITELIRRTLLILILVELIHELLSHDFNTLIDLVALIVARKALQPDNSSLEVLMIAAAFSLLVFVRYLIKSPWFTKK